MADRDTVIMGKPVPREEFLALAAKKRRRTILLIASGVVLGTGVLIAIAARLLDTGPSAAEYFAQAKSFQAQGDEKAAAIALRNALQKAPANGEARWMLARLLLRAGDAGGALKEVTRAKQSGVQADTSELELKAMLLQGRQREVLGRLATTDGVDESEPLLVLRGQAAGVLGKDEAAAASFKAALALNPANVDAHLGLAALAFRKGDWENAAHELDIALATVPEDVRAWVMKGEVALQQGAVDGADAAFSRADKAARGRDLAAKLGMLRVRLARGDLESAEAIIAPLAAKHRKVASVQYWRAVTATVTGDRETAKTAYQVVLSESPGHPQSQFGLAGLYYREHQYPEAESLLLPLYHRFRGQIAVAKLLGAVQLGLGHPSEAVATLQPVLERASEDPQLLALLGNAYLRNHELERGTELLGRAAELAPGAAGIRTQLALGSLARGEHRSAVVELEAAVALDPKLVAAETLLVLAHLQAGDTGRALAAARAFVDRAPQDPAAHNLLGGALQGAGKLADARAAYERAVEIDPGFVDGQLNLARLDQAAGNPAAARAHYQSIIVRHPQHPVALTELAETESREGRLEEAARLLELARQSNPRAVAPRLALVRHYVRRARPRLALTAAEEALAIAPHLPAALRALAEAQLASGSVESALLTLERLAGRRPDDPSVQIALGSVRQRSGDAEGARAAFSRALELDPASIAAKTALARQYLQAGDSEHALRMARELERAHAGRPDGAALAGDVLMASNQPAQALFSYQRAQRIAPSGALVAAQVRALRALDRVGQGSVLAREWLKAHPDDRRVRQLVAELDQGAGKSAEAIAGYEALLRKDPRNVGALNNLAWLYLESDPARALALAEQARDLAPDHPAVLDTLGWMLLKIGKSEQAAKILERAAQGAPTPEHQYHYAAALAGTDRPQAAEALLETALAPGAEFPGRAEASALLDSLAGPRAPAGR